jgi:membrane-associated phospholipid phosphatase
MICGMKLFFISFPSNLIRCFSGKRVLWHLLAILLTVVLVQSGFDWWFYQATHTQGIRELMFPAVRIGFFLPFCLPILLLLAGSAFGDRKFIQIGWSISQAEILGLLISSGYKAITGRAHPAHFGGGQDISRVFQFGFMRGGVFWGWPSSHTAIAFAMAMTVLVLLPKTRWVGLAAIVYALYVGVGVSTTIHWFSDFVAGSIIGTVIGVVVGRRFRAGAA